MSNNNLHAAKSAKNDEFYTQLTDIENELAHYENHFKNKVIYCNCDNEDSNFVKYFQDNFRRLGLKQLIYTDYLIDGVDFRNDYSVELLKEADIVVTNPPFSLFREYVAQLMEHDKKFLIIGSKNTITYKEVFPLIKDNKIWLGYNMPPEFKQPDGTMKAVPAIWFTNLDHKKRNEEIILYKEYNEDDYPTYDNYDAVNVDKVKEIPKDYDGAMGVPITFLNNYNPDQFEIMSSNDTKTNKNIPFKSHGLIKDKDGTVNGKTKYVRIVIKAK